MLASATTSFADVAQDLTYFVDASSCHDVLQCTCREVYSCALNVQSVGVCNNGQELHADPHDWRFCPSSLLTES